MLPVALDTAVQVTPFRRLGLTLSAVSVLLGSPAVGPGPSAAHASPGEGDHLTVTVRGAGRGLDGTFQVYCRPDRGSHPDASGACRAVDRNTRWGKDAFAPVPDGSMCTMLYGGPATARVTGRWAGRSVDATYDRRDGCEIERWDRFVPLLPDVGPAVAR
ncbi:SSI family serine proteinase inhibitor [Streptomyces sp. NPDC059894]|uniref:SSI family serine proteinase inhibitor n=1 Tax=unclassified Streptomyces TaxID=2593676 RepID=UPI003659B247